MKKTICFLMILILIFCICGCRQNVIDLSSGETTPITPSQTEQKDEMSLLYVYSDSFNPYTAKTAANREIAGLLYDSLIKTDNKFEIKFVLAKEAVMQDMVCTVTLNDATFTDGSAVTASDVVYSYNLAKENARYMHNFYEVTSVAVVDSKTVAFKLSQYDEYFVNLLDFPVLKSGSSGVFDADGKEIIPIGCGRYLVSPDEAALVYNPNYYGNKCKIKKIKLINSPDAISTAHYVEVGATGMYYTDSGDIVRMSGKKTDVNLNRFVYIGINSGYAALQSKEIRYAISSALNREDVCKTAYFNNAIPADGFFNPMFEPTSALQTIESRPNSKITVENLSKIGYNSLNADGFYTNSSGNYPAFTLLVNSENASRVMAANLIAQQCRASGIQMNVITCTYEQYIQRLSSGSFQLYLGEVQLLDNMDFTQLVTAGGSAAYGVQDVAENTDTPIEGEDQEPQTPSSSPCKSILDAYHSGQCSISDVAGTLLTEMPQIPICYLNGVLFYDTDIKGEIKASSSDIYLEFENYEF